MKRNTTLNSIGQLILFYRGHLRQRQRLICGHVQSHSFGFFGHVGQTHFGVGVGTCGHEQLHIEHVGQRQITFGFLDLLADGVIGQTLSHSVVSSHFLSGEPAVVCEIIEIQMTAPKITIVFIIMIKLFLFLFAESE